MKGLGLSEMVAPAKRLWCRWTKYRLQGFFPVQGYEGDRFHSLILCRWWCVLRSCWQGMMMNESTPSFCWRALNLTVSLAWIAFIEGSQIWSFELYLECKTKEWYPTYLWTLTQQVDIWVKSSKWVQAGTQGTLIHARQSVVWSCRSISF